jgi:hypothetical protein
MPPAAESLVRAAERARARAAAAWLREELKEAERGGGGADELVEVTKEAG